MAETALKPQSGLTVKALIIGLAILVFALIMQSLYIIRGVPTFYNPWPTENTTGMLHATAGYMFGTLFLIALITKKVSLTKQEVAVITAMTLISTMPWVSWQGLYVPNNVFALRKADVEPTGAKYFIDWFVPGSGSWTIYNEGGDVFGAAGGRLFVWMIYSIFAYLFTLSLCLPLRRSFIDVQKLPYPYLQPVIITLDTAVAAGGEKPGVLDLSNPDTKRFMIGLILGILAYLIFIPKSYPWGKDWPAPIGYEVGGIGKFWFFNLMAQMGPILPWYHWAMIDYSPEIMATLFFLPMDLLASSAGVWLFWNLLWPPIGVALGLYRGELPWKGHEGNFCCPMQEGIYSWRFGELVINWPWVCTGGIIFYGLITLLFAPKPFIATIKGIWSKVEGEENEPVPYKVMWGIIVLFGLIFLALMVALEIPIGYAIFFLIMMSLLQVSMMRIVADFGIIQYWSHTWYGAEGYGTLNLGGKLGLIQPDTKGAFYAALLSNLHFTAYPESISPPAMGLTGYKVSDYYKTENRGILISQIIALVVSIPLAYVLSMSMVAISGGLSKTFQRAGYIYSGSDVGNAANLASYLDTSPTPTFPSLQSWGLGALITAILVGLRTFIPWWSFHPVAFLLPGLWPQFFKIGNSILTIFVIKLIVIKIGGTTIYEKLTRVAAGLVAGGLIGRVILLLATLAGGPLTY